MKFRASIIQTPGRLLQVYGQIPLISAKYINHNVGNEGFSCTSVGCLNEGVGVVVMTNSDNVQS
jgi:hypothetical protein